MARYTPLFYRGSPASIPQVVAHIQRTLTEEDPDYTPLRQRMPPASIPEIVAHIQEYLTANVFVTMEDLGEDIAAYIEAHPEIVGVFTVNGASGNVTLDASDIPIETGEDPTVAGAISYLSSQLALLVADAVLSVNGVTPDDSHNVTLTGANIAQDANTTKKLSETFGPASASAAGTKGLVPAPQAGDENRVLSGSGAWVDQPTGAVQTVCNVGPNAQGNVPLLGSNIPLQSMSLQTVAQAIAAVDGKTGSDIPTSTTDNTPISTSLSNLNDQKANQGTLAYVINGDTYSGATIPNGSFVYWNGVMYTANGPIVEGSVSAANFTSLPVTGGLNAITKSLLLTLKINGYSLGALNANASNYVAIQYTVPAGYKTTGMVAFSKIHPAVSMALNLDMTVGPDLTGTQTLYLCYFTPVAIVDGYADFNIYIQCVKE